MRVEGSSPVPTMDHQGLSGFEATVWHGLMGPSKMPSATLQLVNEGISEVMVMPDEQEKMALYGAEDGDASTNKFSSSTQADQLSGRGLPAMPKSGSLPAR